MTWAINMINRSEAFFWFCLAIIVFALYFALTDFQRTWDDVFPVTNVGPVEAPSPTKGATAP